MTFGLLACLTACGSSPLHPDATGAGAGGGGGGASAGGAGGTATGGTTGGTGGVSGTGGGTVNDAGPAQSDASLGDDDAGVIHSVPLGYSCYGGPSAQSMLDKLKPTYTVTYSHVDTKASTELTITPRYAGGQVNCNPPKISRGGPPDQPPSPDVEVQLGFVTADGVFDETFSTSLKLSFIGHQVDFTAVVAANTIKGTFKAAADQVIFYGFFDPGPAALWPPTSGNVWARNPGSTADQRVGGWK